MKLSIGFSPCPNDTFIFYGLATNKIKSPIDYKLCIEDVAELNTRAFSEDLDVTKISINALGRVLPKYQLLDSGAALGENCGPLLIAKRKLTSDELRQGTIAIPGKNTTANLLLSMAFPGILNKKEYLFSDIEEAVIHGHAIAGLIIHETRFTYSDKGLVLLMDLGNFWEERTKLPLPLGGIAVKASLPIRLKKQVNLDIKNSLTYAYTHTQESLEYCATYAQEISPDIMQKHIDLYVNSYSLNLGKSGQKAILAMYEEMRKQKLISRLPHSPFF